MVTETGPTQDKQITVDVPEDRVPEFYAYFAHFLAGSRGRRGRGRGPGRHGYGGHGRHGHGCHGHGHAHHGEHPEHPEHQPVQPEGDTPGEAQQA